MQTKISLSQAFVWLAEEAALAVKGKEMEPMLKLIGFEYSLKHGYEVC